MMRRACFSAVLLAGSVFVLSPAEAAPIEDDIRAWVGSIDASPDWTATYGGLAYDQATDTATLTGLTVAATAQPGAKITIATITVAGYAANPAGGFAAKLVKADGGAAELGFSKIDISDFELQNLSVPALTGFAFDQEKPFTSMMRGYAEILKAKLASGRIGKVDVIQTLDKVESRISYEHFRIEGFADGKVASVRSGPLSMEAPNPQGLVTMTIGSAEGRDMDLGAFVHVYNPDAYANGVGDMVWRNVMAMIAYHDIEMTVPGARISLGEISVEDFRLRQPPKSFAPLLDIAMAQPAMPQDEMNKLAQRYVVDMFAAFSVGRIGLEALEVTATGVDRIAIRRFYMDDFSIDGLGEFAFEGIEAAIADQGAASLARFAFGGLTFPSMEDINRAIVLSDAGVETDPRELFPHLGFFEVLGLDIQPIGQPKIAMEKFRFDLGDYVGFIPTRVAVDLLGLVVPTDVMTDRESRRMFETLGYKEIVAGYSLKTHWEEASERLVIDEIGFSARDVGSISGAFTLSGVPRAAIEDPELLQTVAPSLSLVKGSITFKDDSIVGKGLDLLAGRMNAPPEKFRQQFADAMPFLLSMTAVADPKVMAIIRQSGLFAQLTPVVKQFIATPGSSITISLDPAEPVGLPAIAEASEKAPDTLIRLLGVSFSGKPGEAPAPAPAPAANDNGAATGGGGGAAQGAEPAPLRPSRP